MWLGMGWPDTVPLKLLGSGALFDDPASLVAMTTPAPDSSYGLGITLQGETMGHAGYIAGFRSVANR